jgi:uncharacterized protein YjiS (DUF1127 family)
MTAFALKSMTNHHGAGAGAGAGALARVLRTFRTWHDRSVQRAELARWTDYELHDIGLSHSTIAKEINKPFWRA